MSLGTVDFDYVADLVRRESAIVLDSTKEYLVETRLTPLANEAGVPRVEDFIRQVRTGGTLVQRRAIVEALTTNETSWFRDPTVFNALRKELLPQLLADRPHLPLRVWSAAASTGQEAYSLAIALAEDAPGRRFEILGTDIAESVLQQARRGWYPQFAMNRGLSAQQLVKYFTRSGAGWQIGTELQAHVTFRQLNLAAAFPPMQPMDLVLMRNVLIYFDQDTKAQVLRRVRQVMSPKGWLVLGTAENTRGIDDGFEAVRLGALTAYRPRPTR